MVVQRAWHLCPSGMIALRSNSHLSNDTTTMRSDSLLAVRAATSVELWHMRDECVRTGHRTTAATRAVTMALRGPAAMAADLSRRSRRKCRFADGCWRLLCPFVRGAASAYVGRDVDTSRSECGRRGSGEGQALQVWNTTMFSFSKGGPDVPKNVRSAPVIEEETEPEPVQPQDADHADDVVLA